MKRLLFLLILIPITVFSQTETCIRIDSVYSTAKLRELGNRDIRFGIQQIAEDVLSEKYCLSEKGNPMDIEVYYFGIPKKSLRIAGMEKTNQITQVGIRIHYKEIKYEGLGESDTEVRAVMIELVDGQVPFSKMTVSNAIKKAIIDAVNKIE
jgi:hypothetical protein